MSFRADDCVEVRGKPEILKTLDSMGRTNGVPFMPEMFAFCGKRFKIYKRAHKTCNTVAALDQSHRYEGRSLRHECVHLEDVRCNGSSHGGCQAACLVFWQSEWLKLPDEPGAADATSISDGIPHSVCTELDVIEASSAGALSSNDVRYRCQATELRQLTKRLSSWNIGQYVKDWASGNETMLSMVRSFAFALYEAIMRPQLPGWGTPFRWFYDKVQRLRGGVPYPNRPGTWPRGAPTPVATLGLQSGELVRVKSYDEILRTLTRTSRNRGMPFSAELVPYCGGVYRVRSRIERFVDEQTGKMTLMKTPAVALESVWCRARYAKNRLFCPRSIYGWWREIWLERVPANAEVTNASSLGQRRILCDRLEGDAPPCTFRSEERPACN